MSKAVYAWMAVFLIVISCAGNRINPNPLFMTTENSEQTILYTGVVSGNEAGNIKLVLKLKRNGSFMSEFVYGN
ncbi:MAG TPA: hypothetical protein VHI78_06505, partial [Bacteroidales bacterium]|nr:hypothetical protein [Bacteroidales bacterium]